MLLSHTGSFTNQIYRCQCPRCGLTREHISKILCHDYVSQLFLRFIRGFRTS
ncbi:hypothetical protein F383_36572 [Gossypium arboreum]|uniref:Uncharacterized protein n=1 Tax=Gossypium arboreum TaxID=29729 RepID=A0A0B0M9P8_GOSAR|nr:hypothetical protein F383_36572 [Gossypium arboreum]